MVPSILQSPYTALPATSPPRHQSSLTATPRPPSRTAQLTVVAVRLRRRCSQPGTQAAATSPFQIPARQPARFGSMSSGGGLWWKLTAAVRCVETPNGAKLGSSFLSSPCSAVVSRCDAKSRQNGSGRRVKGGGGDDLGF
ncbi:hypothetical protein M0R45_008976 [Rubus argutus]|uniref:Uncharacterized protein n=1 Tax=Rubus argutus TaxID=59490 RepID=A0AAW1Y289_RUBAR